MTETLMTAVNVEAVRVSITGVDFLFTFVDISASESITTITIRACASETANTIGGDSQPKNTNFKISGTTKKMTLVVSRKLGQKPEISYQTGNRNIR